jgi:hypothetical protein
MAELVCGLEQRKKLEAVPLSNHVMCSRIVNIPFNILKNPIKELASSTFSFSMQLHEITDISQSSQLLVLVLRFIHADAIKQEFLFCESLLETTRAIDVLEW